MSSRSKSIEDSREGEVDAEVSDTTADSGREERVSEKAVDIVFIGFQGLSGVTAIFFGILSFAFFGTSLSRPFQIAAALCVAMAGVLESMKRLVRVTDDFVRDIENLPEP